MADTTMTRSTCTSLNVSKSRDSDLRIGDGWGLHTDLSDEAKRDRLEAHTDAAKNMTEEGRSVSDWIIMNKRGNDLYLKRLEDRIYTEKERVSDEYAKAYAALPECRNDREFGMALGVMLQES